VTRLGPAKVGHFLQQQSDELTRIWRLARATARPTVFPGLLDGVVQPFFERAGELLLAGGPPDEVWEGLVGVVRWAPAVGPGELTQEWAVLVEVLAAACESVNAEPPIADWLARAAAMAEAETTKLVEGRGAAPPGVVTAVVFSSVTPRQPRAETEETAE
jgi:hypothetical protein